MAERAGAGKAGKGRKKEALRPDTTLAPVGEPAEGLTEVYVRGLPVCCLATFKEAVVAKLGGERRIEELRCPSCGRGWYVESSLDERVLGRFVTRGGLHGGPRATGGTYPAA